MAEFKAGQRLRLKQGITNMAASPGTECVVQDPPYLRGYLKVKWEQPANGQKDGGYDDSSFEAIPEPTYEELAEKWRELSLGARNIHRQLQEEGFNLQSRLFGISHWSTTARLGEETSEYRFYKEDVVKTETIL